MVFIPNYQYAPPLCFSRRKSNSAPNLPQKRTIDPPPGTKFRDWYYLHHPGKDKATPTRKLERPFGSPIPVRQRLRFRRLLTLPPCSSVERAPAARNPVKIASSPAPSFPATPTRKHITFDAPPPRRALSQSAPALTKARLAELGLTSTTRGRANSERSASCLSINTRDPDQPVPSLPGPKVPTRSAKLCLVAF